MDHSDWPEQTDETLVRLALEHQEAFGVLIQRYEQKLLRYIQSISSSNLQDAEDILQDAFIKVYRNLNGFDQSQKFSSWIYRIVRNEAISAHRKRKSRAEGNADAVDDDVWNNFAAELDIQKDAEQKERSIWIRKILDQMDVKYKEVLVLKFLEEKDYKEISYILRKPMGTVATLISRAKKQFRDTAQQQNVPLDITI